MKSSFRPVARAAAASMLVAAGLLQPATAQPHAQAEPSAASPRAAVGEVSLAATVLTFEGGLVGIQPFFYFTRAQLGGELCRSPNTCDPVYYAAIPLGQLFNDWGAIELQKAVTARAGDPTPITLFGHSQGGQVIYTALRNWAANPGSAPDPAKVSWVSIGNPENVVGGRAPNPVPAGSPYSGIEVIKQYDGWADAPSDRGNFLAQLNAAIGRQTTHVFGYFNVDVNDPANIRYTPDNADGTPGKITYVFVPTPILPLVQMTGPLAPLLNPVLDPILRPIVEAGYDRPFDVPASSAPAVSAASIPRPASVAAPRSSVGVVGDSVPEVQVLDNRGPDQNREQDKSHHRGTTDRGRAERLGVDPVRDQVGPARRSAAGQRVDSVEDLGRTDDSGHRDKEKRRLEHR